MFKKLYCRGDLSNEKFIIRCKHKQGTEIQLDVNLENAVANGSARIACLLMKNALKSLTELPHFYSNRYIHKPYVKPYRLDEASVKAMGLCCRYFIITFSDL